MKNYNLDDFIDGYNRLNSRNFNDLSYSEIRKLMAEYEDIDPTISQVIHEAYTKAVARSRPSSNRIRTALN
tara:strand:- start:317 stop:529 length:213 start_codon:yes stop_codon:yes gene_type:complete